MKNQYSLILRLSFGEEIIQEHEQHQAFVTITLENKSVMELYKIFVFPFVEQNGHFEPNSKTIYIQSGPASKEEQLENYR